MNFGSRLFELIKQRGLTQLAFAGRIGTSSGRLHDVISGRSTPPLAGVEAWAKELELDPEQTAELRALAEAAHLQRKLDREGSGRTAVVTQISPGNYAINAITGQGRELLILVPHGTAQAPSLEQRLAMAEQQRDAALRTIADLRAKLRQLGSDAASTPTPPPLAAPAATDKTNPPRRVPTPDEVVAATRRLARRNREHARTSAQNQAPAQDTDGADGAQTGDPGAHRVPPTVAR